MRLTSATRSSPGVPSWKTGKRCRRSSVKGSPSTTTRMKIGAFSGRTTLECPFARWCVPSAWRSSTSSLRASSRCTARPGCGSSWGLTYNLQHSPHRQILRRLPHHNLKVARNHPPMHVAVEQLQIFRRQGQRDVLRLARFQVHALESAQLLYRCCHRTRCLVYVKLHRLSSGTVARVLYLHTDARRPFRMDLRRVDAKVAVLILCVAHAITKRVKRCCRHIDVAALQVMHPVGFGGLVVVVGGQLANMSGNRNSQPAAGVVIAE